MFSTNHPLPIYGWMNWKWFIAIDYSIASPKLFDKIHFWMLIMNWKLILVCGWNGSVIWMILRSIDQKSNIQNNFNSAPKRLLNYSWNADEVINISFYLARLLKQYVRYLKSYSHFTFWINHSKCWMAMVRWLNGSKMLNA